MPGSGNRSGGAAVRTAPAASRQDLSVAALTNLVPKSGANSRAIYAREGLINGSLSSQSQLKSFDFAGLLDQNRGMSGRMINVIARNSGGSIQVGDGASSSLKSVSAKDYRDRKSVV